MKESKDTLNYITFESQGNLKGIENLRSLLFAIKKHRNIYFTHENFETGKKKKYSISPYLLKEYQNRWYIIGKTEGIKEFRTFGIDRIEDIEIKADTFKPDNKTDPVELFDNIVGLTYSLNELEEVVLSFTSLQGKYVKALPLHKSQDIISENEKELIVKLTIIPNYEFKQKILMLGDTVKIIKPKWIVDEIKETLKKTIEKYK